MKILNKKVASKEYLTKFLPREMRILQMVRHPHIAEVYEIIETERHTYFIMELACNGDLLDYINSRHYIPEPEARYMCNQLLEAMEYCHSLNIAHRDLKCENILLGPNLDIKLGGTIIPTLWGLNTFSIFFRFWFCFGSVTGCSQDPMWILLICCS